MVLIVWIGVQPRFFLDRMAPTLDRLTVGVRASTNAAADRAVGVAVVLPPLETVGKANGGSATATPTWPLSTGKTPVPLNKPN